LNLFTAFPFTGLDPAGPLFKEEDCQIRLCKGDAHFVEAVQTNKKYVFGFGNPREDCKDILWSCTGNGQKPKCITFVSLSMKIMHDAESNFSS
jgi:hypothetical protein